MCRFIETIRIENSVVNNLKFHEKRMHDTMMCFYPECTVPDLSSIIEFPEKYKDRTRCRILYGKNIEKLEYFPYQIRKVEYLQAVECNSIDYGYKYEDRNNLNRLYDLRGECDDVLIIRNGLITDTSIANIALLNYYGKWETPTTPLLKGTMRSYLLESGFIEENEIEFSSIHSYSKICLFNAMIPFGEVVLSTEAISASSIRSE